MTSAAFDAPRTPAVEATLGGLEPVSLTVTSACTPCCAFDPDGSVWENDLHYLLEEARMVENQELSVVRLTSADRSEAADLLTDAFFDNPGHTFIYPDAITRRERLRWLMYANLGAQLEVGQSFARRNADQELVAMAFWHAPGAPRATAEQLAAFGFLEMANLHGEVAFERMRGSVEELERRRQEGLRGRPGWYLNKLVLRGDYRGLGLGTRMVQRELREVVDS